MQARTKNPNTPRSDRASLVPHIVTLDNGQEIEVMAADPFDALEIFKASSSRFKSKYCSGTPTCCCGGHSR